jgi:hypothetical protein
MPDGSSKPSVNFKQRTFSMGAEQRFQWEKALASADAIEDEELLSQLSVRD